jgi:hypothetical protein
LPILLLLVTGLIGLQQPAPPTPAMRADVNRLAARAEKLERLWPWQGAIPEVQRVVRHGKAAAPLLLALLDDDPDAGTDGVTEWRVQQQAALALCRIFRVSEECGHIYCNRASREANQGVKKFWSAQIERANRAGSGR